MATDQLPLPAWAEEMRRLFRAGANSQFLLSGNVFDLVAAPKDDGSTDFVSLRQFLTDVMFEPFDVVVHYDPGRGVRVRRGGEHFQAFLEVFDAFRSDQKRMAPPKDAGDTLDLSNLLPRDPPRALEMVDRFVRGSQRLSTPLKVAVIVDYAHFIVPQGEAIHLSGALSATLIRLLDWGSDPAITGAFVATVLITENLADVHRSVVESPYAAKIAVGLPDAAEIAAYVAYVTAGRDDFERLSEVPRDVLAAKLVGLSRVNVRSLLQLALHGGQPITMAFLTKVKKELIEKEAMGRIEFVESKRTLDDVAGHAEAKAWMRQDAALLKRGRLRAIPMGYLLCGRIGTGKTYLVECWAGEIGIPVVAIKNFRERWVGATESNLERIFGILRALGQVLVFVDEADQATGRRGGGEGDAGLSGRIYGMLAKEMSDTKNRGKILWVFATSRPDLVEVDLKRQGRLDVHIPLFPPGDRESRRQLFAAMAKKVGIEIASEELPELPDDNNLGGNEMEGILVRALRLYETQPEDGPRRPMPELVAEAIADVRSSAHVERLALMDLVAVKECTDTRFLPPRFRDLGMPEVDRRLTELRLRLGE